MKLSIDTTDMKKTQIRLLEDGNVLADLEKTNTFGSQVTLPMIEEALKKANRGLKDLTEIEVNEGPGSYTGTRVGISIANALAYSLMIPVNGKMTPQYQAEPKY